MKHSHKDPIKVALYGMDTRAYKTLAMFLKGPCKGIAEVTDEFTANIDIIDADSIKARDVLEERQSKTADRPIILLSLQTLSIEGTLFLKKPVQRTELIATIKQAFDKLNDNIKVAKSVAIADKTDSATPSPVTKAVFEAEPAVTVQIEKKQSVKKHIDQEEKKKLSKHKTATDLTEGGYLKYIGHVDGLDFSDKEQLVKAVFNPKHFYLGYVQSACKVARSKNRVMWLKSGWKPLFFLPEKNEVWLDADIVQLRAFAGLTINNKSGKTVSLSVVDNMSVKFNEKMENYHDINSFIWMLAIWTSKGRYPKALDINRPVYLKQWPNFTRLIITPHALRIAALLIKQPRTMTNIVETLNIKPQYVFVFLSAAYATGLAGQAKRQADLIVTPEKPERFKVKGLLGRIIGKLRR